MKTINKILLLLSIGILLFFILLINDYNKIILDDDAHCGEKMDTVSYPPYDTN